MHKSKPSDALEDSKVSSDPYKNAAIFSGLAKNIQIPSCSLSYLHIVKINIDEKQYKAMFEGLSENKSLKSLRINMCDLSSNIL